MVAFFKLPANWCMMMGLAIAVQAMVASIGSSLMDAEGVGGVPFRFKIEGSVANMGRVVWRITTVFGAVILALVGYSLFLSFGVPEKGDLSGHAAGVMTLTMYGAIIWTGCASLSVSFYGVAK